MGFGWQETVALLSGFIAKEVVAASLVVVYQTDMSDMAGLQAVMGESLAPASGLALMVFTLLYMPCLATICRETGSWRWAVTLIMMGLILSWFSSWLALVVVVTLLVLWFSRYIYRAFNKECSSRGCSNCAGCGQSDNSPSK